MSLLDKIVSKSALESSQHTVRKDQTDGLFPWKLHLFWPNIEDGLNNKYANILQETNLRQNIPRHVLQMQNVKKNASCLFAVFPPTPTEDGRSMSVFSLYGQLSQGRRANFPAFMQGVSH